MTEAQILEHAHVLFHQTCAYFLERDINPSQAIIIMAVTTSLMQVTIDRIMKEDRSGPHPSHDIRASDGATCFEICINCGAHDEVPGGWGQLAHPCPEKKGEQEARRDH